MSIGNVSRAVISVIGAGNMGSAIAARMHRDGAGEILSPLEGRSNNTLARAKECGMIPSPYATIAKSATHILSVVPPAEALAVAQAVASAYRELGTDRPMVFADCNAMNSASVREIKTVFDGTNVKFIDGSIIGLPPSEDYNPGIFVCADPEDDLQWFKEFVDTTKGYGLNIFPMEGASLGDASSLKMAHSSIVKGTLGLMTSAILAANASSPATARGLVHALEISQPRMVDLSDHILSKMPAKAYRFVKEMEEVGGFIGRGEESKIFKELEVVFGGIAKSLEAHKVNPSSAEAKDVADVIAFCEESRRTIQARDRKN
ncbi:hypothetical protein CYLTODRAFT_426879 [Cylindrobasidium torrendii FP15055 ss-10]|uniref:6-phosphogluconate dehydrogenase C-terminal domain-like protein n=1 Tax=Cylindrobasidium torrendii FP15055 ss-10 TaxID=1314674 RepID=A0A0D7AW91_9AGAR|nr:hypothetical protein CYLTODRAFT_426879 [Cylindrobasidium torrendii FP15055 ss-10]